MTANHLRSRNITVTGTPVRPGFQSGDTAACRLALGLDPWSDVVVIMGGSQGASGINELMLQAAPLLAKEAPRLQCFHLTGTADTLRVKEAYAAAKIRAVVHPFYGEMEIVLGAASAAISRAGASSLAELAALRVPSVLIPYPTATDDHQLHNARAYADPAPLFLWNNRKRLRRTLANFAEPDRTRGSTRNDAERAGKVACSNAARHMAETMLEQIAPRTNQSENKTADDPASRSILINQLSREFSERHIGKALVRQ